MFREHVWYLYRVHVCYSLIFDGYEARDSIKNLSREVVNVNERVDPQNETRVMFVASHLVS